MQCTTCNYLLRCRYVFVWKAALFLGLGKLGHPASMPWYRNLSQQHFRQDCSVHSFFALTWNVQYCCLFIALFCSFLARCEQTRTLTKERKPPIIRACIMRKRHYSRWSQVFGFLPRLQGDQKYVHETAVLAPSTAITRVTLCVRPPSNINTIVHPLNAVTNCAIYCWKNCRTLSWLARTLFAQTRGNAGALSFLSRPKRDAAVRRKSLYEVQLTDYSREGTTFRDGLVDS